MYPEIIEATHGKSQIALYDSPGLKKFCDLSILEPNVRGLFRQNNRCFAAGNDFYEVFADGTFKTLGPLVVSNQPVLISGNQVQLLILAGGNLWVFNLQTGALTPVNMAQFGNALVSMIGFSDGFFLALLANSQTLQVSNLLDGTTWTGLNVGSVGVFPDNVVSMLVDHREVWLWGSKSSAVYYDTGGAFFPFAPIPGVYLETGSVAIYAPVKLDNSVMWLHLDDRGSLIAYRAVGYAPQRISNHAVEFRWSQYARVDDVVGYSYVDQGHSFWHLYFPTANASWRYDVEGGWHEVGEWTPNQGFTAHRSQCHAYAFGKHLVGDTKSGVIYDQSINYPTYDGRVKRRLRISPTVSKENTWLFHRKLQLDCETGIATQVLTGPSPSNRGMGIRQWVIADQAGVTWVIQVNDAGEFQFSKQPGLVAQSVYLLDTVLPSTPWLLGIDSTTPANPYITLTLVALTSFVRSVAITSQLFITTAGGFQSANYVENGVLTKNVSSNTARGPLVSLRYSDDNAHTWSNYHDLDCGKPGAYRTRLVWRRLGRSRNRTYEVTYSDPVPLRIVEADLDAVPGFEPVERLTNLINKGA